MAAYNCDTCSNFAYDEEIDDYECMVDMDEDEYVRLMSQDHYQCPYYNGDDEYKIVRHQM